MKIIKILFNHFFIKLGNILPRFDKFDKKRCDCYRLAGLNIGKNVEIAGPLNVRPDTTDKIYIGDGTYLNTETRFGCQEDEIRIGKFCRIGPKVSFETAGHNTYYDDKNGWGYITKPIVVEDRVWIGAGSIILPGIIIHEGAAIAAGAGVNKDVDAFTLVGGVPAKMIKSIDHT